MKAALLLSMLLASSAQAVTIGVHTWSEHASNTFRSYYKGHESEAVDVKFREKNWGGYVIFDNGLILGGYKNSYWRDTFYAGYTYNFRSFGPITPALTAALATGYESVHGVGELRPMLMPSLIVKTPLGVSIRYSVAPAKSRFFQHISFERKF